MKQIKPLWTKKHISKLYELPFNELLYRAQTTHRKHFNSNEIELCTLLSIKTGRCPEDCAYCPQSGHFNTDLKAESLIDTQQVISEAKKAKAHGATRFCMGAAWRSPPKKALPKVIEMIKAVNALGMESCVTLGMLDQKDAIQLKEAGLDYYNHNLDSSPDFYSKIISTRTYADRLNTLENVSNAGINVCCGGILGMGETREDRIDLIYQLTQLTQPPQSIPINQLIPIPGTPLANNSPVDPLEFVRTIAVTRLVMPRSMIRLSAGRENMSEEMQSLCFMAGANSVFSGETLLTASNPSQAKDTQMLKKLGLTTKPAAKKSCSAN